MAGFIEGLARQERMLLPEHPKDYVDENSPLRAIDAFLDMPGVTVPPSPTGRPNHQPGLWLRIYLYGDLNQIQPSRRLERECGRNLEVIWLPARLKPDFKAIADLPKDNGPAIRKTS